MFNCELHKMWNTLNRAWNTLAIPIRLGWTTVTTAADLFVTLKTMWKEWCEIAADTAKRVKNVLLGAWNHGKWYHKAMNIPLSPIIAWGTALEWAVRTTIQPIVNGVVNTVKTGVNTVKNARKWTFGRIFSKKPLSDFSYNHLETRWLKLNNWFEKLQFARWKSGGSKKSKEITKEVDMGGKKENKEKKEVDKENKANEVKKEEKKTAEKTDKKVEKKEEKIEKDKKKEDENKNKEVNEWYKKAKEILKDSQHWTGVYNKIRKEFPDLKFIFDENSSIWSVKRDSKSINVWLKMPSDEKQIAPLNTKKDKEKQARHLLLHEMWHVVLHNNIKNSKVKEALDILKWYFDKNSETASPLSQLDLYRDANDKAKEDLTEMFAMYANSEKDLDTYLSKLISDNKEDVEYRKKFKIAKISDNDAQKFKETCKDLVKNYSSNESADNRWKEIKLNTKKEWEEMKLAA